MFVTSSDIIYTDEEPSVVEAAAWSVLSHILLPSSTALRSLRVLFIDPPYDRVVRLYTFCSAASKNDSH